MGNVHTSTATVKQNYIGNVPAQSSLGVRLAGCDGCVCVVCVYVCVWCVCMSVWDVCVCVCMRVCVCLLDVD